MLCLGETRDAFYDVRLPMLSVSVDLLHTN